MINLSLQEIIDKKKQSNGNYIALYKEFLYDKETPFSLYSRIKGDKYSFILESVAIGFYKENARYTFFGIEPRKVMKFKDYKVIIEEEGATREETFDNHPLDLVKAEIDSYTCINEQDLKFPFTGGAIGYMGYDTVKYYEDIPIPEKDELDVYEGILGFYDYFFMYDHFNNTLKIVGLMSLEGDLEKNYQDFNTRVEDYQKRIIEVATLPELALHSIGHKKLTLDESDFQSNVTKEQFMENVEKAIEYIKSGDSYQVVLSQRLSMKTSIEPIKIYEVLRSVNPSPYMFFVECCDYQVVGTSPEVMTRVVNGNILVCPLAGTRPRGKTEEEDRMYEQDLIGSEKERAEHIMLVDLARNDVGKVSKIGSVKVEELMHFLKFSYVQHLNTNVKGLLAEDKTIYDVFKSILPRGTVSGSPKVRSMEIISELENDRRSVYAGAICYFSYSGNLDSAITIRTMVQKDNTVYVQAGAGIVYDSDPEAEYEETINKAKALLLSVKYAESLQQ